MKRLVAIILVMGFLVTLMATSVSSASMGENTAPIAQTLVREGDFADSLSQVLLERSSTNEMEAENNLASIGIAPRNGWISDYPVTPTILGELEDRIGAAADSGVLDKGRSEALGALENVETEFGLYVRAGSDADSGYGGQAENAAGYPDTAVGGYYDENGPPTVTYYPPPDDYAYMYDWVDYPFWWSDAWFPGFFVLADFDIIVDHDHHHRHGHHHHMRVTNHVVNNSTGRIARIDPVTGKMGDVKTAGNMNGARTLSGTAQTGTGKAMDRGIVRNSTGNSQEAMSGAGLQTHDMDRAPDSGRSFAQTRGSGETSMRSFSGGGGHSMSGFSGGHSGGFSGGHGGGGRGR